MKMKAYCLAVIKDFMDRGLIKIYIKNNTYLFNLDSFRPSFRSGFYSEPIKIYVGDGIMMYYLAGDVIAFEKDGNILCFNATDVKDKFKIVIEV